MAFQTFPLLSIHQFFPLNHGQTRPPITFHSSTVSLLSCQTPNHHFSSSNCHTYNSHIHLNITYSTSTVTCVIVLTCQLSHFYRIHSIIISHPSALTNFSNTSTPTVLIHQLSHFHPRNTSIIWFPWMQIWWSLQSSKLAEALPTDPGLKSGISVHMLISTLKKKCRWQMNDRTFSQNPPKQGKSHHHDEAGGTKRCLKGYLKMHQRSTALNCTQWRCIWCWKMHSLCQFCHQCNVWFVVGGEQTHFTHAELKPQHIKVTKMNKTLHHRFPINLLAPLNKQQQQQKSVPFFPHFWGKTHCFGHCIRPMAISGGKQAHLQDFTLMCPSSHSHILCLPDLHLSVYREWDMWNKVYREWDTWNKVYREWDSVKQSLQRVRQCETKAMWRSSVTALFTRSQPLTNGTKYLPGGFTVPPANKQISKYFS